MWFIDIATDYILFLVDLGLQGHLAVVSPLLNLFQFVHEEDTFALGTGGWLHDPGSTWVLFEFFNEDGVILRKDIGHGHDVKVTEVALLILFGNGVVFLFHFFPESLDILDH